MPKFELEIQKTASIYEMWEVEADNEQEATWTFDEGKLVSTSTKVRDLDILWVNQVKEESPENGYI